MQDRGQLLALVSFLPQGILDLVLDILGYGGLVDGVIRMDGRGEDALAVPVGNLVRIKSFKTG